MHDKDSSFRLSAVIPIMLILIPALIFTAIPNIFFGFESAEEEALVRMTEQAKALGGAYLSLEDFEKTQIDAVVTSMVSEYENNGTTIDRVDLTNSMEEDDLLWIIAINSVAHRQNLEEMSAEDVRTFCLSRLTVSPSLESSGEGDAVTATLQVEVQRLDPEQLMTDLGFDEEAKVWAGALHEVLSESGALDKYRDHFEPYRPSYSGDTPGGSGITPGGSSIAPGGTGGNAIDISAFVSPNTKNNLDLAAYAVQAWENGWGYVWGTYGNVLTQSLFDYKLQQYPDGVGKYADFIRANWLNRRTADCIGLIKGYGWLDAQSLEIRYGTNGMPDYGANQMYQSAVESGTIDTMPEIVGLAVWKPGHIGVYIGNGYVIEAMGTKYGVVKTELARRNWSGWCKIPYLDYLES